VLLRLILRFVVGWGCLSLWNKKDLSNIFVLCDNEFVGWFNTSMFQCVLSVVAFIIVWQAVRLFL